MIAPRLFLIAAFALSASHFPALAESPQDEARFLANTRQLTLEGRRSGEGYFAPDGKAIVFQSEREPENPFYQIYTLDLETGDQQRVSPGVGKTTCSFFRPGTDEVLFASTHLDPQAKEKQKAEIEFRASGKQRRYSWDYDEQMDIFSAKRDGTGLKRLTTAPGYDAEGAYSPDGKKIVFCSLRDAYPPDKLSPEDRKRLEQDPAYFGEIYIMNADGSDQRRLTQMPGYDGGPFFSPDGQRIIWRHFDESGVKADIYTMKTDGSDVRRLTDFGAMSWAPYLHPSGQYAIFASNKLGFSNFELFLVDALGQREPVRITYTDGFDGLPVFSPDGRKLLWTSGRTSDGKSQLFLADWNDEAARAALAASPARAIPAPVATSDHSPDITVKDLRADVEYLASDALAGRMTGSAGAQAAASFIAEQFRKAGLKPLSGGYDEPFEFNAGIRTVPDKNALTIMPKDGRPESFALEKDFRPLSLTANGEFESEVVFAGYGLVAPGDGGSGYDSYAGLDVKDKIVLAMRYVPEDVEPKRRQELNRYAALRFKALMAREHGAKAILFVTGPNSPNAGELAGMAFDGAMSGSDIIAASISGKAADALLAASGKTLKQLQTELDKEDPHAPGGFVIPGAKVKIATAVEFVKKSDRNVVGVLPPADDVKDPEYVLVCAHYDHLGLGETGAMLRAGEENKIHPGADDNASGTAAVLELAASLARERAEHPANFRRGIIFALWSGEEIGLIGSAKFTEKPPVPLSKIAACVNFDMVGRLRDNRLMLQGIGSSNAWRRLIEKRNVAAGFNVVLQEDPYLPTDVTSFYPKNVPVLNFFTGSHDDYHRPTDTADKVNYEGAERIAKFARGIVLDLARNPERPDYAKVAHSEQGGGRETLRAYLGTIPDYATEVVGVKLTGVRAGSPAEAGGLKGGDIIVEFAGQKIANIYDYTYALDAVKIGKPVEVVVKRDDKDVKVTVTPAARK